jgi:hypothetical protein
MVVNEGCRMAGALEFGKRIGDERTFYEGCVCV